MGLWRECAIWWIWGKCTDLDFCKMNPYACTRPKPHLCGDGKHKDPTKNTSRHILHQSNLTTSKCLKERDGQPRFVYRTAVNWPRPHYDSTQ